MIEPAFQAALVPRVRPPPLTALHGRAAGHPTVALPPVAGPTDVEHRRAPRPAAPQRAPHRGAGCSHPTAPRRRRLVRGRGGATWENDPAAGEAGRAHDLEPRGQGAYLCAPPRTSRCARAWSQGTATASSRGVAGVERRVTAHSGRVGLASELTSPGASTTDVPLGLPELLVTAGAASLFVLCCAAGSSPLD